MYMLIDLYIEATKLKLLRQLLVHTYLQNDQSKFLKRPARKTALPPRKENTNSHFKYILLNHFNDYA